ncbi:MAG: flagellin FliC, partial [Rhodobacteraceae bacterium]|nr:flagellin FliC [Paracoccaceae bacterium]
MALTIATDYGYLRAEQAMNTANTMREHAMQRLSTGSKLNSAADNAAGVAIASRMTANVTAMRQAMTNAADAQGLLGTAEGGMVEMENIVQRMRELVTQAANDTLNSGDRSKVKVEMDQLVDELDRIAA